MAEDYFAVNVCLDQFISLKGNCLTHRASFLFLGLITLGFMADVIASLFANQYCFITLGFIADVTLR